VTGHNEHSKGYSIFVNIVNFLITAATKNDTVLWTWLDVQYMIFYWLKETEMSIDRE
jgi:hypothetical protein